jgi:uncharacterized protein YqgV (UPF0045/DUF77 family)
VTARAEFTVEPFEEGNPGPHVQAAITADSPLVADVGPFATSIEGDIHDVLAAAERAVLAAMEAGATRVSLNVTVVR